jgi:outer membrane receptor protein involved in Fe transport
VRPPRHLITFALVIPSAGLAEVQPYVDIPPQPLRTAIVTLGDTASVTIGLSDPTLGAIQTHGIRGRMSPRDALTRMTKGTTATFVQIDPRGFRVLRRPAPTPARSTRPPPSPASAPMAGTDIVVTASKRSASLADYPGSVTEVDVNSLRAGSRIHGSEALIQQVPVLTSTHLGPGRNKLFIRGIADSSFNGPTQATVGQYLGDVRLTYSAPDPDLALYDIKTIEVLEGPQGTLYGAGSLGGVIRIEPNAPDLEHWSGSLSTGLSATAHGAPGVDGALIANAPLISDRVALRLVAYGAIDGGYIDDPSRDLHDINRTLTRGGRVTLRYQPAPDWTIDLGGVLQNIDSRDGQYSLRGLPAYERSSVIAQPFDNDYTLGSLVVRHAMGNTSLTSATSAVFHDVGSTYDASSSPLAPMRYHEEHDITVFTNETRLAHHADDGSGWVIGTELLRSSDKLRRTLGPVGEVTGLTGTSNTVEEVSLFGEATLRVMSRWFVTGGGRLGFARQTSDVLDSPIGDDDRHRHDVSILPSIGLLWKPASGLSVFARYQEGYRPGGLAVQSGNVQRFEPDSVATSEIGVRIGGIHTRFSATASVSYAHWEDVQADLVDTAGLPYTANIGSGRVLGLEIQSRWSPVPQVSLDGALFLNDSNLSRPTTAFAGERDATLPNIADLTARLGITWHGRLMGHPFDLMASAHYVGHSRLGVGPALDIPQGGYTNTAISLRAPVGRVTVSLDATNILEERGNVFSFGNPFGVTQGNQMTPLRPRTLRLGTSFAF